MKRNVLVLWLACIGLPVWSQHRAGLAVQAGAHFSFNPQVNVWMGTQRQFCAFYSYTPGVSPIGIETSVGLLNDRFLFRFSPYRVILQQRLFQFSVKTSYRLPQKNQRILFGFNAATLLHKFNEIGYTNKGSGHTTYYGHSNIDSLYGASTFQASLCAGYGLSLGEKQKWGLDFLLTQSLKSILQKTYIYDFSGYADPLVVPANILPLTLSITLKYSFI